MMNKMVVFYKQPENIESFVTRFKTQHLEILKKIPGVTSVKFTILTKTLVGENPYWAYSETFFESADSLKAALKSPELAESGKDAMEFAAGLFTVILATEETLC
ncbi:MAG: EthD family reductase [bacterium]|nr:EthD family reductase [bacterium]